MSKRRRTDFHQFYEEVGAAYPEEQIVYRDLRGKLRRKFVLPYIRQGKGNFLDLGCNTGVYLREFHGQLAVGVDLSIAVLRKARSALGSSSAGRFYFLKGDIQNLDFLQDELFDFILCSEVLEHLLHPEPVFAGIARLLKPGGRVLITTPNYRNKRPTWVPLGELKSAVQGEEYYHTAYRPEELEDFARKVGLCIQDSGTLEWEVKYAAKLPAIKFLALRAINQYIFRSDKIARWNQRLFEWNTLFVYWLAHFSGLERIIRPFIKEGVRSFLLASKPVKGL